MIKTTFHIKDMDCPSEEQMIRMRFDPVEGIISMDFDLPNRTLHVYHTNDVKEIADSLSRLDLGEHLISSVPHDGMSLSGDDGMTERKVLCWVLGINFLFFILEMTYGWISSSMGLVADSLDMLADSFVYGLSLMAIGAATRRKKQIAGLSGYIQMALAVLGLVEVIRRFTGHGEVPVFQTMIVISCLALAGNTVCLWLIQKSRSQEAHMKASYIFTANDILINLGVIIAGVLVFVTSSRYPDLIIGSIVFLIVMRGAFRILKLAR